MPESPENPAELPASAIDHIVDQVALALEHLKPLGPEAEPARSAVADILAFAFGDFTELKEVPRNFPRVCPSCSSRLFTFSHERMLAPKYTCNGCGRKWGGL